jgi:hypothetical protein
MPEILCPRCPLCDRPPLFIVDGSVQAFCGNASCEIMCWNPTVSLDENLMSVGKVRIIEDETDQNPEATDG